MAEFRVVSHYKLQLSDVGTFKWTYFYIPKHGNQLVPEPCLCEWGIYISEVGIVKRVLSVITHNPTNSLIDFTSTEPEYSITSSG